MKFKINYPALQPLTVLFTRGSGLVSGGIALVRHGLSGLQDPGFPTHALLVTEDNTQLFGTEETPAGLVENSLEKYTDSSNRIVAAYRWDGWKEGNRAVYAMEYLATIRRRNLESSRYDFFGLLSFVPGLKRLFKPDPQKQWCSENVASIHKSYGASFIDKTTLSPDQLLLLMQASPDCYCILNYYVKP